MPLHWLLCRSLKNHASWDLKTHCGLQNAPKEKRLKNTSPVIRPYQIQIWNPSICQAICVFGLYFWDSTNSLMPTTTTRGKFLRNKKSPGINPFRPLRPDLVEVHLSEKFLLMSHGHHLFSFFPSAVAVAVAPVCEAKKLQVATFPTYLSFFLHGCLSYIPIPFGESM